MTNQLKYKPLQSSGKAFRNSVQAHYNHTRTPNPMIRYYYHWWRAGVQCSLAMLVQKLVEDQVVDIVDRLGKMIVEPETTTETRDIYTTGKTASIQRTLPLPCVRL